MDTQKASQKFAQLNNIISAYANISADIMLNKNLDKHLKDVTADLYFLRCFIEKREMEGSDTLKLQQIAEQLRSIADAIIRKQQQTHTSF